MKMKKFLSSVVILTLIMSASVSFAQNIDNEPCLTPACQVGYSMFLKQMEIQYYIDNGLEVPMELYVELGDLAGSMIYEIAIQRPMALPFNGYYPGYEEYFLRLAVEGQFGPELSALIPDEKIAEVWDAVQDEFEHEFYASDNELTSVADMATHLSNIGVLGQTGGNQIRATKVMKRYDLSETFLPPAIAPPAPLTLVNPVYQTRFDEDNSNYMLAWPNTRPSTWRETGRLVKRLGNEGMTVEIIVENEAWHRAVIYYLNKANNYDMDRIEDNVRFIYLYSQWSNASTFSPLYVDTDNGRVAICPRAGVPWSPTVDDEFNCELIAGYLGIPMVNMTYVDGSGTTQNLHLEGGNLLSDGNGTAIVSDSVFSPYFNPGLTQQELEDTMETYLGITDVIVVPLGSPTAGHITDYVMMADAGTVIVSEGYYYLVDELNELAAFFDAYGFDVLRVPLPFRTENDWTGTAYRTYTHSVIAGDIVIVPGFGDSTHPESKLLDDVVAAQFAGFFPGKQIKLVRWPNSPQGPWYVVDPR